MWRAHGEEYGRNVSTERMEQLAVILHMRRSKASPPYHSFILPGFDQLSDKMALLTSFEQDIELQLYVIEEGPIAHVTPIKFQKKGGHSSAVVIDSLGVAEGTPAVSVAAIIQSQGIDTIVTKEGRQTDQESCWVFALEDGEQMRITNNLYERLHTYYKPREFHTFDLDTQEPITIQTVTTPPQWYNVTQTFTMDRPDRAVKGIGPYLKENPNFRNRVIHYETEENHSISPETLSENVERHTHEIARADKVARVNGKVEQAAVQYQSILRNKTFEERETAVQTFSGALLTHEKLDLITKRQCAKKFREEQHHFYHSTIPADKITKLQEYHRVFNPNQMLNDEDLTKLLDIANQLINKQQQHPINILSVLQKAQKITTNEGGFNIRIGRLEEIFQHKMDKHHIRYSPRGEENEALALLKDSVAALYLREFKYEYSGALQDSMYRSYHRLGWYGNWKQIYNTIGVNPNVIGEEGEYTEKYSLVSLALHYRRPEMVEQLIENGADLLHCHHLKLTPSRDFRPMGGRRTLGDPQSPPEIAFEDGAPILTMLEYLCTVNVYIYPNIDWYDGRFADRGGGTYEVPRSYDEEQSCKIAKLLLKHGANIPEGTHYFDAFLSSHPSAPSTTPARDNHYYALFRAIQGGEYVKDQELLALIVQKTVPTLVEHDFMNHILPSDEGYFATVVNTVLTLPTLKDKDLYQQFLMQLNKKLEDPRVLETLDKQTASLLAVTLSEEKSKDLIVRYNEKNQASPISTNIGYLRDLHHRLNDKFSELENTYPQAISPFVAANLLIHGLINQPKYLDSITPLKETIDRHAGVHINTRPTDRELDKLVYTDSVLSDAQNQIIFKELQHSLKKEYVEKKHTFSDSIQQNQSRTR